MLDSYGVGQVSNVIKAVNWAIQNKKTYNIRVMNLSLGAAPSQSYKTDPLCQAVAKAVDAGIVVVVAAGNWGKDASGNPIFGGILSPANSPRVITVGATNTQKVNVRIIAATHRDLEARVAEGLFREDLYYRLSVIPITLPALRERRTDIPGLVAEFFERGKRKHSKPNLFLPSHLMSYFVNYRWPGNIRELENLVKRYTIVGNEAQIIRELATHKPIVSSTTMASSIDRLGEGSLSKIVAVA